MRHKQTFVASDPEVVTSSDRNKNPFYSTRTYTGSVLFLRRPVKLGTAGIAQSV